jgi:hypothetical protein
MPAANFEALNQPLPAGIGGIIGQPLDVDITWPSGGALPFNLTLFYPQEVAERLGVEPGRLRVLRYDPAGQAWQTVPVSGFSNADSAPPPPQPTATVALSPTPDLRVTVQALGNRGAGVAASGDTSLAWVATQPVSAGGIYAVGWATGP